MNPRISMFCLPTATAFLVVASTGCDAEPRRADAGIPVRYRAFAEAFEQERRALGIPGAAVAIVEQGELAFAQGFGTKGQGSDEPVEAGTTFRIGSMTKLVTALGILSAADAGLLDLDAPISETVPELSLEGPEREGLTLRRLLSQQSGLSDFLVIDGPRQDEALAEFVAGPELADNVGFSNPPGTFWNYSNPNYYLAGRAPSIPPISGPMLTTMPGRGRRGTPFPTCSTGPS
jgi:CubicO group peptidase (beta-lactamase class C family)